MTYYSSSIPVQGVTIDVQGLPLSSVTTDSAGNYSIPGVSPSTPLKILPHKLDSFDSGITTFDGLSALAWQAGLITLTADEQLACDVTGNKSVTAFDGVRILQFVVGLSSQLPVAALCKSDWIFVPSVPGAFGPDYSISSCTDVGGIAYSGLTSDITGQNFVALLLGDCNASWTGEPASAAGTPTATPTDTPTPSPSTTVTETPTSTPVTADVGCTISAFSYDAATHVVHYEVTVTDFGPDPSTVNVTISGLPYVASYVETRSLAPDGVPVQVAKQDVAIVANAIHYSGESITWGISCKIPINDAVRIDNNTANNTDHKETNEVVK